MSIAIAPDDAFIVVDLQHDFLPGGALGVPEGERVFAPINALVSRFGRVYATRLPITRHSLRAAVPGRCTALPKRTEPPSTRASI